MKKIILFLIFFLSFSVVSAENCIRENFTNWTVNGIILKKLNACKNWIDWKNDEEIVSVDVLWKDLQKIFFLDEKINENEIKYILKTEKIEKNGKLYFIILKNSLKIFEFELEKEENFASIVWESYFLNNWNHIFTILWTYEPWRYKNKEKLWLYIDWIFVKKAENTAKVNDFLEKEKIKISDEIFYGLSEKYKKMTLSKDEKEYLDKFLEKFYKRNISKVDEEKILKNVKNYISNFENKILNKNFSEQEFKNFLKVHYLYSEIIIKNLLKNKN